MEFTQFQTKSFMPITPKLILFATKITFSQVLSPMQFLEDSHAASHIMRPVDYLPLGTGGGTEEQSRD